MTTNQSPYDSGHDSSYSHASGPGHPPSSRGNSDIDDQVDRYIREQRVATLISDTPSTTTSLPQSQDTQQRDRSIALSHRLLATPPHSITHNPVLLNIARAHIQDITHSNPANDDTHTDLPHNFRDSGLPTAPSNLPISDPLIPDQSPYIDEGHDYPPPWCATPAMTNKIAMPNHQHYFPSPTTSTTLLPADQPFATSNTITPQPDNSCMTSV
jgi:hypothetical protein